jgi:hypothetical protein
MSRRNDDTVGLVLIGALGVWLLSSLKLGGHAGWPGEGGTAKRKTPKLESKEAADDLAALPTPLDTAAMMKRPKSKTPGKKAPPIIDVHTPRIISREEWERRQKAKKKPAPVKTEGVGTPARKTRPAGTVSASPELEPHHGPTLPPGYNPGMARAQAPAMAAHLARKGPRAYSRAKLEAWQRFAGLRVDGGYAGSTRGALVFYGVDDPPRPYGEPIATLPYHPPDMTP